MAADLYTALQNLRFDVRMKDINLRKGEITQAEIDKDIQQLKDLQDQAETLDFIDRDDQFVSN